MSMHAISTTPGDWRNYTPVWTSTGTAPVLNNGGLLGQYIRFGNFVFAWASLTMGSSTTFGTGSYLMSLPIVAAGGVRGTGEIFDSSTTNSYLISWRPDGSMITGAIPGVYAGNTSPMTFAVSDVILNSMSYNVNF